MSYEVDCTQDDGFMIKSDDRSEAVEMIKRHARQKHDMDLSDDDAHGMIKET